MISKSVLICFLIIAISGLQYRNHQLSSQLNHEWFQAGQFFQTMQFIGVIVVLLAVGACCFFFRGAVQPTPATQAVVVANNRQNRLEEAPRQRPQQQNYVEPPSAPAANPLLDYFNSQRGPNQTITTKTAAANPYSDSNNPYITHKEANKHLPQWKNSQILPYAPCSICEQSSRAIQRPWAVVDCSQDHVFHLGCLSQNRKKCMTEHAGNGINRCPKCREVYSPVVKVYCGSCVRRSVQINLTEVSDEEGAVSPSIVKTKFGVACQECLGQ